MSMWFYILTPFLRIHFLTLVSRKMSSNKWLFHSSFAEIALAESTSGQRISEL